MICDDHLNLISTQIWTQVGFLMLTVAQVSLPSLTQ